MSIGSTIENNQLAQSDPVEYGISIATRPSLVKDFIEANKNDPHLNKTSRLLVQITKAETSNDGSGYLMRFLHTLAQPQILAQLAIFQKQNKTAEHLFKLINSFIESLDHYPFKKPIRTRYQGETLSRALIRVKAEQKPPEILLFTLAEQSGFKPDSHVSEKGQIDKPANIHVALICFLLIRHLQALETEDEPYLNTLNLICNKLKLAAEGKGSTNEATRGYLLNVTITDSISFDEFTVAMLKFANQLKSDKSKAKQSLFQLADALTKTTSEPVLQGEPRKLTLPTLRILTEDSLQDETTDIGKYDNDIDGQLDIGSRRKTPNKDNDIYAVPVNLLPQLKESRAIEFFRKKETVAPSGTNRYQLPQSDWLALQNWFKNFEEDNNETRYFKLIIFICTNLELSPIEAFDCLNRKEESEWKLSPDGTHVLRTRTQQPSKPRNTNLLIEFKNQISLQLPFTAPIEATSNGEVLTEEWLVKSLKKIRIPVGDGLAKLIPLQGLLYDMERNEDVVRSILKHGHYARAQPGMCNYTADSKIGDDQSTKELNVIGSPLKFNLTELERTLRAEHKLLKELANGENFIGYWNHLSICVVRLMGICGAARGTDELFEGLNDFDLDGKIAYVEDKVKDPDAPGRIVPIPDFMIRILKETYLPQLKTLLRYIRVDQQKWEIENFKGDLKENRNGIPLFFLLEGNQPEGWRTITARDLLIDQGLPTNWQRHFVSTELSLRADRECVEYVMGHSDGAFTPHGVESLRAPKEMLDLFRAATEGFLTEELDIALDSFQHQENFSIPLLHLKSRPPASWGRRRRKEQREKDQQSLRAIRHQLIREHATQFSKLKKNNAPTQPLIDQFSTRAIELGGTRPEEVINKLINDALSVLFRMTPHKNRLSKQSKTVLTGSVLQQEFIGHTNRVQKLTRILRSLEQRKTRTSKKLKLIEACVLIAWESRRPDASIIKEIQKLNFHTFSLGNEEYIQIGRPGSQVKTACRVCVSQRVAYLIKDIEKPNAPATTFWGMPLTNELVEALSLSRSDNLETAQDLIDLAIYASNERNIFELPLAEAKLLDGSIVTQEMNLQCLVKKLLPGNKLHESEDAQPVNSKSRKSSSMIQTEEVQSAADFEVEGKKLSDVVKITKSNKKSTYIKALKKLPLTENKLADHLKNWLIKAIEDLPHHGRVDEFRQDSLIRSFDLVYPMLKYFDGVLLELPWEQDEISEVAEDYYDSVERSNTTKSHEISRINNFFRFLASKTNFPLVQVPQTGEVERSEIIFSESDFQALLTASDYLPSRFSQEVKLLFILTYRFGFRRNEALNLRAQDIHLRDVHLTIQVQGRKGAKTKYPCSNRISQCWRNLPGKEQALINAAVNQKNALNEGRIFSIQHKMRIYSEALLLLKDALGMGSLHTLRHSFVDRNCGLVFGYSNPEQEELDRMMNQLSLGKPRAYSLFSLARMVGHMSLEDSTLSRYFHATSQLQKPKPSTEVVFEPIKTENVIQLQPTLSNQLKAKLIAQIVIRMTHHKFDEIPSLLAQFKKEEARRLQRKIEELRSQVNQPGYLGSDLIKRARRTPKKEIEFIQYAERYLDDLVKKKPSAFMADPLINITSQWTVVIREENLLVAQELVKTLLKHEEYLGEMKFLVKKGSCPSIDLFNVESRFIKKEVKVSRNVSGGKIYGFPVQEESQFDVRAIAPKPALLFYMVFFLSFCHSLANIESSQPS